MALGSIMNSLWDAWAKIEKKPLWKLLIDLHPEEVVNSIDWRYLEDALTKDEALKILREKDNHKDIELSMVQKGPKAYSTAGWLGLSDKEISKLLRYANPRI